MWAQEGSEFCTWHYEDGVVYRRHISLNEDGIAAENAAIRADGGPRTLSFGKCEAQMPLTAWYRMRKKYPELLSGDKHYRRKAWDQVKTDPEFRKWIF